MTLQKKYYTGIQIHDVICECISDYDTIIKILSKFAELPSAEPERKTGRWTRQASDSMVPYQCADCKAGSFIPWNYCPRCGARMEAVDD